MTQFVYNPQINILAKLYDLIDNTMRHRMYKYKTGRIELNDYNLIPTTEIRKVLKDGDQIVVYSKEFGLNSKVPLQDLIFVHVPKKKNTKPNQGSHTASTKADSKPNPIHKITETQLVNGDHDNDVEGSSDNEEMPTPNTIEKSKYVSNAHNQNTPVKKQQQKDKSQPKKQSFDKEKERDKEREREREREKEREKEKERERENNKLLEKKKNRDKKARDDSKFLLIF